MGLVSRCWVCGAKLPTPQSVEEHEKNLAEHIKREHPSLRKKR